MIYALMFAMQAATPQPALNNTPTPWPDQERELRLTGALDRESSGKARLELQRWASCIARNNRGETARLLTMDFTSGTYNRGMRMLSRDGQRCFSYSGSLSTGGLLFAGELAEALLQEDSNPLVRRLTQAAATPAQRYFSFTDQVSTCVVRSVPNDVAALLATERGSTEERTAIDTLAAPAAMCARASKARRPMEINPVGLRAMLATAAYRSIARFKES